MADDRLLEELKGIARSMITASHSDNLPEASLERYLREMIAKTASILQAERLDRPELVRKISNAISECRIENIGCDGLAQHIVNRVLIPDDKVVAELFDEIDHLIPGHKYDYWIDEVGKQQKKHSFGFCAQCEYEVIKSRYSKGE